MSGTPTPHARLGVNPFAPVATIARQLAQPLAGPFVAGSYARWCVEVERLLSRPLRPARETVFAAAAFDLCMSPQCCADLVTLTALAGR